MFKKADFKAFHIFCLFLAMALFIWPYGAQAQTYVFSGKFGSSVTGDGEFNYPYSVAVDSNANVYVADEYNHRIQRFGPSLPPCEGDLDGDGDVDGTDLAIFAADFGRTDCPVESMAEIIKELKAENDALKRKIRELNVKLNVKIEE